jgi:DnaJ family protein C protein 13
MYMVHASLHYSCCSRATRYLHEERTKPAACVRANLSGCSWPWPGSEAATAEAEGAAAKAAAADVLSALLAQPTHGPRVSLLLHKLLPPGLVASIAEGPPEAVMRTLSQVRGRGQVEPYCCSADCLCK